MGGPTSRPQLKQTNMATFIMDFRIADAFGKSAILDTFNRAFKEWRTDYKYLTELVIALNRLCWYHYEKGNIAYSKLYADLYHKANDWARENLKGEEFDYYFQMTD